MIDLKQAWPLGLTGTRWRITVGVAVLLLVVAFAADREISLWAQSWPDAVRGALAEITPYGESDWILYPSAVLFLVTALVAVFVKWKLMRTMLWQFAGLYAFIFAGVGLPSLISTLAKRAIGRGRPMHFDQTGLFGMQPNWADWTYQSFPSGHATTAFALAAVIGFVSPRWWYPGLGLAVVIGVSRVALGVHYPSDVVAGAFLGILGAYLVRWLFAKRGWLFAFDAEGHIRARPMSSLKRYLALKKRDIAPKPTTDRP